MTSETASELQGREKLETNDMDIEYFHGAGEGEGGEVGGCEVRKKHNH